MITLQKLQNRLDDVLSTNDYIESAYIYYHRDRFVLSSRQGPVPIEDFDDRTFAEELTSKAVDTNDVNTRMLSAGSEDNRFVITMVKAIPIYYNTSLPMAYVVINIKGFYLQEVIDSIKTNPDAVILVADAAGNVITQNAGTSANVRHASEYMSFPAEVPVDSYEKEIDGAETLVSYVSSEKYGWTYIYTVPMDVITAKIKIWLRTALIVSVFVILLGLAVSLLFSKRIFDPLKRMLQLLKNSEMEEGGKPGGSLKEVTQIERNVSRILDRNRRLELMMGEYEAYSRKKFLASLLSEAENEASNTLEKLTYYGLRFDPEGYVVTGLLSMDDYGKYCGEHTEKARNELFLGILDTLENDLLLHENSFIVEAETNQLVWVMNYPAILAASEVKELAYAVAKNVHASIHERYPFSFTAGISSPYKGIANIPKSFYEASAAADHRLILENGNIILYESVERSDKHIAYPVAIEKKLLSGLKMGDSAAVAAHFADFEAYIQEHATEHMEVVRGFFLQLFSSSVKCIYEMDSDFELGSLMGEAKHVDLLNEETMRGMVVYLGKVYDQILAYLENKRSAKNKELTDEVKAYVTGHIADDLTLERLSEQFYISSSHLRKLFKDETGDTVKNYIQFERMRIAKKLLASSGLKVADIAQRIGYMSAQSFAKVFKQETGKTPVEFRDEYQRQIRQEENE